MYNYSTQQAYSIAILTIFFIYFFIKISLYIKKIMSKSLLKKNLTLKKLKRLSWDDFELFCMEFFEKEGWKVKGNSKKGADGGVDIWMTKSLFSHKTLAIVQCKRYENTSVTVKVVREMYGLMHEYEANQVYIVTTSHFTKECYKFIKGKNIELIHGDKLIQMLD